MSETKSRDREKVGGRQLEDLEAYEPPRIVALGSFVELTSGSGGGSGDTGQVSAIA
jgi:hypothetical protein